MPEQRRKRARNEPWKHIYSKDRKYTARVNRAMERGQYTEPSTPSQPNELEERQDA